MVDGFACMCQAKLNHHCRTWLLWPLISHYACYARGLGVKGCCGWGLATVQGPKPKSTALHAAAAHWAHLGAPQGAGGGARSSHNAVHRLLVLLQHARVGAVAEPCNDTPCPGCCTPHWPSNPSSVIPCTQHTPVRRLHLVTEHRPVLRHSMHTSQTGLPTNAPRQPRLHLTTEHFRS